MAEYIDAKESVAVEGLEQSLSLTDGTAEDKYDMTRIGKKQELRVGCTARKSPRIDALTEPDDSETSISYRSWHSWSWL